MLEQVTNLMIPKAIARKPIVTHGTYRKYGFVLTLHQYCNCPRCGNTLNAGPNYQPNYCDKCGQRVLFDGVEWKEDKELRYLPMEQRRDVYEPFKN